MESIFGRKEHSYPCSQESLEDQAVTQASCSRPLDSLSTRLGLPSLASPSQLEWSVIAWLPYIDISYVISGKINFSKTQYLHLQDDIPHQALVRIKRDNKGQGLNSMLGSWYVW